MVAKKPDYEYRGLKYEIKKMGSPRARYFLVKHNGNRVGTALTTAHAKTLARVHADGLLGLAPKLLPR